MNTEKKSNAPKRLSAEISTAAGGGEKSETGSEKPELIVGGVQRDTKDLVVYTEQQVRHALKVGTHVQADVTIRRWEQIHRERYEAKPKEVADMPVKQHDAINPIPEQTHVLVGRTLNSISNTPLEDLRRGQGLDKLREELFAEVIERISLANGIRMLDGFTRKEINKRCYNVKHVGKWFPQLTATEVAMLPLLGKVPEFYVLNGTAFDSLRVKRTHFPSYGLNEGLQQKDLNTVPTQLEMRVDGIAYGDDTTFVTKILANDDDDKADFTEDDNRELVPYDAVIRSIIQQIVMLTIEFPRMYELVQEKTPEAVQVGVGLVYKEALSRVRAKEFHEQSAQVRTDISPDDKENSGVTTTAISPSSDRQSSITIPGRSEAIELLAEALAEADNPQVEEEAQTIASLLIASSVMQNGKRMSLQQLVHLIGMLDHIPHCLLNGPFVGSLRFYGTHVLFADSNDVVVEVCPLSGDAARTAKIVAFDEAVSSTEGNRTMIEIQERLVAAAQTPIFQAMLADPKSFQEEADASSYIEARALQVFRDLGITLQVLSRHQLDELKALDDKPKHITEGRIARFSLKMGREETDQYASLLTKLGPKLLQYVKVLSKEQMPKLDPKALVSGQLCVTTYNADDEQIKMYEPFGFGYSLLQKKATLERSFLTAVAVGQSIWKKMENTQHNRWNALWRAPKVLEDEKELIDAGDEASAFVLLARAITKHEDSLPKGPHASNYVATMGMDSPEADFSVHFACYVLAHEDFVTACKDNRVIADKYKAVKRAIGVMCGEERDFSEGSLSVKILKGGLQHQFPGIPDTDDIEALQEFMMKQREQCERREEELGEGEDDEHEEGEALAEADRINAKIRETLSTDIQEILIEVLEIDEEENEALVLDVANAIVDTIAASTNDELLDDLRDALGSWEDELSECIDEPIDAILYALEKNGLI